MALLIERPVTTPGIASIGFEWNDIVSILPLNVVQNFTGSISLVSQDGTVGNIKVGQYIYSNGGIVNVSTGQLKINRVSKTIHHNMNFGGLSATTCANKLMIFAIYSPFLAPAL